MIEIPKTFTINITNKCNLRCNFCFNSDDYYKNGYFMDFETFKKSLNYLKENNISNIDLTPGVGECLIHPEISKFIKYAKSLNFKITLISSLNLNIDNLIDDLKDIELFCSLYGNSNEQYKEVTKTGSFTLVYNNILKLIKNKIKLTILKRYNGEINQNLLKLSKIKLIEIEDVSKNRPLTRNDSINDYKNCKFLKEPLIFGENMSYCCFDNLNYNKIKLNKSLKEIYKNLDLNFCNGCPWFEMESTFENFTIK